MQLGLSTVRIVSVGYRSSVLFPSEKATGRVSLNFLSKFVRSISFYSYPKGEHKISAIFQVSTIDLLYKTKDEKL